MKKISLIDIGNFLLSHYGIKPHIKPLAGYDDLNFLLNTDGEKSILKITVDLSLKEFLYAQNRVLNSLKEVPGIGNKIPQLISGLDGAQVYQWDYQGSVFLVRRLSFLDGQFIGESEPSLSFYSSLGVFAGQLDRALMEMDEPVFQLLELEWDLFRFSETEKFARYISDPGDRTLVEYFYMRYRELVQPVNLQLRRSLIHNDINDWNVLFNQEKLCGLIDFGDMVYSATIHELSIAMAYSLMNQEDPYPAAIELVRSYNSVFPIEEKELAILYYLVAARLCTTVVMAARKAHEQPDVDYYQISARPAWPLLRKWIKINPQRIYIDFLEACGLDTKPEKGVNNRLLEERKQHFPSSLSLSYDKPIQMNGSALQYMYDDEGDTYLDGVNNIPHVGHCHPGVVAAGQRQMAQLNTNTRYLSESLNTYAHDLLKKFPDPLNKVIFVNSGSAATDLAIRLARAHTGKNEFIVLDHAYHGNNLTAIDLSPYKFNSRRGSGKSDHIHIAPIPDTFRGKYRYDRDESGGGIYEGHQDAHLGMRYADDVRNIIQDQNLESSLAGYIAESVSGCGGQVFFPENYLGNAYKPVREAGGLCIADEVQTGFGRLGEVYWGFELYGVIPDIVILGKPMGNGHPIGAVVFTEDISRSFENGPEFFSSFGGNPVSCEIGMAVLRAIEDDGLQDNALRVGKFLMAELLSIQEADNSSTSPVIGQIRGKGLFIGIELVKDLNTREPDSVLATKVVNEMKKQKILLSTDGPEENVIKFKPPLCFTMDNARELIDKLITTLNSLTRV